MRVRRRYLPRAGTRFRGADRAAIRRLSPPPASAQGPAVAGVVPHAGWEFSGRLALEVFSTLPRTLDTIVIIGGHLGPADGILCAFEDAYETPLGPVPADLELLGVVREAVEVGEDRHPDNTVEVHLPFVPHLFPRAKALALRAAPSSAAQSLGEALAAAALRRGGQIAVVGSTDLTHYGPNYGFAPAGGGEAGLRWVREVNDRRFIEGVLAMDVQTVIRSALEDRSACSAGGAAAAIAFARARGATSACLVGYMTSFEVHPADSFVGYAGIVFRKDA